MQMYKVTTYTKQHIPFNIGWSWFETQEQVDTYLANRRRLAPTEYHQVELTEWVEPEEKPLQEFPLKVDHRFPIFVRRK